MTQDDVLFGYRLQLFDLAARTSVSHACRTFGVHRSTYYALEAPGRPARAGDAAPAGAAAAADAQRVAADDRGADPQLRDRASRVRPASASRRELARPKWGGIVVSPNGVWKVLRRHGLNTRAKRLGLIAGYAAPYEPPREPAPERHIDVDRPGELVGIDCFYVGRLRGHQRRDLAAHRDRRLLLLRLGRARHLPEQQPDRSADQQARAPRRSRPQAAGWRLERVLSDNGNEFRGLAFAATLERLGTRHSRIHAGRPQTNGHVEALHKTILDECWRPAFARYLYPRYTGLRRELDTYLHYYNHDRVHHGRLTRGRIPADIVYGARKMEPR